MGRGQSLRVVLLALGLASPAAAQSIAGTVRDGASNRPIAGAVVTVEDGVNKSVARGITNERGEYQIAQTSGARSLRVIRIGFRPAVIDVASHTAGAPIDVRMERLPTLLSPVRVLDQPKCPKRKDQALALALWEQTEAALLATIVARESNPAAQLRLVYQRDLDGDDIVQQSVRVDSAPRVVDSFVAVMSAAQFAERGFVIDSGGVLNYFAPDANVLLDEAFATAYCFRLADPEHARPNQVGLAFEAADRRDGRKDISGTVWIDTAARRLRDLEFRYLGLDRPYARLRPGGQISFREMDNGLVLIDRWALRMPAGRIDTVATKDGPATRVTYFLQETGGELASAIWPNGDHWEASLGRVVGRVLPAESPSPAGMNILLDNTGYTATVRADSTFEIAHLLPGPYEVRVADTTLGTLGLTLPAKVRFTAMRDSVSHVAFVAPTLSSYTADRCEEYRSSDELTRVFVLMRVEDFRGRPVRDAMWTASVSGTDEKLPGAMTVIRSGRTGTNGFAPVCSKSVQRGRPVRLIARRPDSFTADTTIIPFDRVTVVRVVPRPRP